MNYNCEKLTLYSKVFEKKGLPQMIKSYLIDVNTTEKDSEVHKATYMNYQICFFFTDGREARDQSSEWGIWTNISSAVELKRWWDLKSKIFVMW